MTLPDGVCHCLGMDRAKCTTAIERLRGEWGWTQTQMSNYLGKSPRSLRYYESGRPLPSELALWLWDRERASMRRLGIDLADLLRDMTEEMAA